MVLKAYIISTPEFGDNIYSVRIPYLEDNTSTEMIFNATLCNTPGVYGGYKKGDCVFVSFEGNKYSESNPTAPVIVGHLYTEETDEVDTYQIVNNLKIKNKVELPANTKIGNYNAYDIFKLVQAVSASLDGSTGGSGEGLLYEVTDIISTYDITYSLTNVTGSSENPTIISAGATATLVFTANEGYSLPDNVTVSGATYTWTKSTGVLDISNPTGDILISVVGETIQYSISASLFHTAASSSNPSVISRFGTATLTFNSMVYYQLPDNITVTGAGYLWDKTTGTVILSNPVSDINIEIVGIRPALLDPLYFTASTAGSTVVLNSIESSDLWSGYYSTDGSTWNSYIADYEEGPNEQIITLTNVGDKVYFKGEFNTSPTDDNYLNFKFTGKVAAGGNIMSLSDGDDYVSATGITHDRQFFRLFKGPNSGVINSLTAPPVELPAIRLKDECYRDMFSNQRGLTSAPILPANTLANSCYYFMFNNCTSLATPPNLPATTLADYCYSWMFGYSGITSVPTLPATTLTEGCYEYMFNSCSSLQISDTQTSAAPNTFRIPAAGILGNTYSQTGMFSGCAGTRASNDLAGEEGQYYTYYTQNVPIQQENLITYNLLHVVGDASNPQTILPGRSATLTFTASSGYVLPNSITVTGAEYTYNSSTGVVVISNPISDVTISITGAVARYNITCSLTNVSGSAGNPTSMLGSETAVLTFIPASGYWLPQSVTVTGATYTFDRPNKQITLSEPTGDISITIVGIVADPFQGLTITAQADTDVSLYTTGNAAWSGQYSFNLGEDWFDYTMEQVITLGIGEKISFKGAYTINPSNGNHLRFNIDGLAAAAGNVMSMCSGDYYKTATTIPCDWCFAYLFHMCDITTAPTLPANLLTDYCYRDMFGASKIITPPVLPADGGGIAVGCYYSMFAGCTNLTSAPELPEDILMDNCYAHMFNGCTSLTTAPELPSGKIAAGCYECMFLGTSITQAPVLRASVLRSSCYAGMFRDCANLTTAPKLPATTLANSCYNGMFKDCTSLTHVPALPATTLAWACYGGGLSSDSGMFSGCTSLIVSDTQTGDAPYAWTIPTSSTVVTTSSGCTTDMFKNCDGTRATDSPNLAVGSQVTYYTQYEPIA